MSESFDPYHVWLGIPPYDQPPSHYRLLGVETFEPNTDVIANAADRQMAHVRSVAAGKRGHVAQRILNEISQAKAVLLHPQRKAAYDTRLRSENRNYDLQNQAPDSFAVAEAQQTEDHRARVLLSGAAKELGGNEDRRFDQQQYYIIGIVGAVLIMAAVAIGAAMLFSKSDDPVVVDGLTGEGVAANDPQANGRERSKAGTLTSNTGIGTGAKPGSGDAASGGDNNTSTNGSNDASNNASNEDAATQNGMGGSQANGLGGLSSGGGIKTAKSDPNSEQARALGGLATEKSDPNKAANGFNPTQPLGGTPGLATAGDANRAKPTSANVLDGFAKARSKQGRYDAGQAPVIAAPTKSSKSPVPSDQEFATSEKQIRQIYAKEFVRERTSAERAAIARFLFAQVGTVDDEPQSKYALLKMTIDYAGRSGQVLLAKQAIRQLAIYFDVDQTELELALLKDMGERRSIPADQRKVLVNLAVDAYAKLKADRRYEDALEVARVARTQAIESRDRDLRRQAQAMLNEANSVASLRKSYDKSLKLLASNPSDPRANLDVGKYLCLVKNDWKAGLQKLLLAKPDAISAAAKLDQGEPVKAAERIAVGDAWKAVAELKGHSTFASRALYWYELARPDVRGLTQQALLRKIRELDTTQ